MKKMQFLRLILCIGIAVAVISSCKKENPNKKPIISSIIHSPDNVYLGDTCTIIVYASDPDGDNLTYNWSCPTGEIYSGNGTNTIDWITPNTAGTYVITVDVSDGKDVVSCSDSLSPKPHLGFTEDFSGGEGNWQFNNCSHSTSNGILNITPNSVTNDALATHSFSSAWQIPWSLTADVKVVSGSGSDEYFGLLVALDDVGDFMISHMYFALIKNPTEGANWVWLWYMPDLDGWGPWDESCYGLSDAINTTGGWNELEMITNSNETVTLKCNGSSLTISNTSVGALESYGYDVTLGVYDIILRSSYGITTNWDNITFHSEMLKTTGMGIRQPQVPSEKAVQDIIRMTRTGELKFLKDRLNK
jgi:hypothetical protein